MTQVFEAEPLSFSSNLHQVQRGNDHHQLFEPELVGESLKVDCQQLQTFLKDKGL